MGEYLTLEEHTAALELVGKDVDAVREDLAHLTETVAGVFEDLEQAGDEAGDNGEEASGGQWCWRTLEGEDRAALWVELRAWVAWFNVRYGSVSSKVAIFPCWPQHPVVVEELTGLMVAWQGAHDVATASDAITAWHERWLWPCRERLSNELGGFKFCTLDSHVLRHAVVVRVVSDDVFDKIVRDDLATNTPDAVAGAAQKVA
jgi:hypothetical protein